jgi:uncharacterized protein (TIGR02246 family)
MRRLLLAALACAVMCAGTLAANTPAVTGKDEKENPIHEELRTIHKAMMEAHNKNDIDGMLKYVHKDAVATWQNGVTRRGHDGIREFHNEMLGGPKSKLVKETTHIDWDDLSIIHGGHTVVAFGKMSNHFDLRDGMQFDLDSRCTVTLVKEDGKWLLTSFQAGSDIYDNTILHLAIRKTMYWTAGIAGGAGLLIGILTMVVLGRRSRRSA